MLHPLLQHPGAMENIDKLWFALPRFQRAVFFWGEVVRRYHLVAMALAFVLSACSTNPLQPDDPNKQSLSPNAKGKALVLLAMPPVSVPYGVNMEEVNEATGELLTGPVTGWAHLRIYPGRPYASERVTPGTYVFTALNQQGQWSACFQNNTFAVDIKEGEVVFLGEIRPEQGLAALQTEAVKEGKSAARYYEHLWIFDNIPAPSIQFPEGREQSLATVRDYVKANMPGVTAPIRLAEYRPAKFVPGTSLGDRVCSAY